MFHVGIMEEVAREQRSDQLRKAEAARLLKETRRLNNSKGGVRYLKGIRNFVNTLRLAGRVRITANKVGLLSQEC